MIIVKVRAEVEPTFGGRRLLKDLLIKIIFSIKVLSSGFGILLDLNNGLE